MSKERFQRTGKTSFYGNYLYGRVVPRGHFLPSLIESDLAQDLPIGTCTADRAYDDTDNHFFLQTRGIHSAIQAYLTAIALDLKYPVRGTSGWCGCSPGCPSRPSPEHGLDSGV